MATLIDSHCHLDDERFREDLLEVVARAQTKGVGGFLSINTHLKEFPDVLAIAERFPFGACSVGVHPHEADQHPDLTLDQLVKATQHPKVVALGETGLDYFYENSSQAEQKRALNLHLEAHDHTGLPLIIHARSGKGGDAEKDLLEMFDAAHLGSKTLPGVIHCFSGTRAFAHACVERGFYLSLSGILTFPKAEDLRAIAGEIQMDRLLVETDAPYLAPVPFRGKRNEPAYVVETAKTLAEIKGLSFEEVVQKTTYNALQLFEKARPFWQVCER